MTFREANGGVTFAIKVVPRSSRNEIRFEGGAVKVRVHAAPDKGRANLELVNLLADVLSVRRAQIQILSGEAGRNKLIRVQGIRGDQVRARLERLAVG